LTSQPITDSLVALQFWLKTNSHNRNATKELNVVAVAGKIFFFAESQALTCQRKGR